VSALWDSLIPAGAGLLGAVIGVIGSLLASRQASRAAIEQVRYAVRYERKAQVMATAYDKVANSRDKLALLSRTDTGDDVRRLPADVAKSVASEHLETDADAEAYLNRNAVWNDPEVDRALRSVQQQCRLHWSRYHRQFTEHGEASTDELKVLLKELSEGINSEAIAGGMVAAGRLMQRKLDEPQRRQ
jgi:hypothetical protein